VRAWGMTSSGIKVTSNAINQSGNKTKWQQANGQNPRPKQTHLGSLSRTRSLPYHLIPPRIVGGANREDIGVKGPPQVTSLARWEREVYEVYSSAYDWCCSMRFWQHHYLRCVPCRIRVCLGWGLCVYATRTWQTTSTATTASFNSVGHLDIF